jgi:uncharacterized membrane protein
LTILVAGLAIFLGVHLVPSFTAVRARLLARLGEGGYKGLYSLASAIGLGLIVWGKSRAPGVPVYQPPAFGHHAALALMLPAFVLLTAAYVPSNLKRFMRHPMLTGIALWAAAHLLANGDLASLLLFGGFGAFALVDIVSANRRGAKLSDTRRALASDLLVLAIGGAVYALVAHFHGAIIGIPVVSW